uniref:Otopetrin n=1 Tax=Trichobilharzia regenti TaxID=157069 RepID=A0AA85J199_TRIRE|nr:unnamed protein product [Trichobilharzia regenti]
MPIMPRKRKRNSKNRIIARRPSVALADYDISDRRSSAMSSLLLLFALFEGMCGFVLPICSAFRVSNGSPKRHYYEDFLIFQICLSLVALAYLQSLICYYDRKENLRRKHELMFMNQVNEARRMWSDQSLSDTENNDIDEEGGDQHHRHQQQQEQEPHHHWDMVVRKNEDKLRLVTFNDPHEIVNTESNVITAHPKSIDSSNIKNSGDQIVQEESSISSKENEDRFKSYNNMLKMNKSEQSDQKSPTLSVTFASPVINNKRNGKHTLITNSNYNEGDSEEVKKLKANSIINNNNNNNHDNETNRSPKMGQIASRAAARKMKFFGEDYNGSTTNGNTNGSSMNYNHNNENNDDSNNNNTHNNKTEDTTNSIIIEANNTILPRNDVSVSQKPSNNCTSDNDDDANNNVKQNSSHFDQINNCNYLAKRSKEQRISIPRGKMTNCCGRRPERNKKRQSFHPLAIIFGDKPSGSKRECYFSRDTEGVNLYLRLGAVGFGFGVMIFDGFKIAEPWEKTSSTGGDCHGQLWIPLHILHFIYVFWQTYFLFKHHRVVFNVQKFVLRFFLCHLAVANLCQWLKTIVDEIGSEPSHEGGGGGAGAAGGGGVSAGGEGGESNRTSHEFALPIEYFLEPQADSDTNLHEYSHGASSPSFNLTNLANMVLSDGKKTTSSVSPLHLDHGSSTMQTAGVAACGSTVKKLAPFLFPCAIEYSLIAGAIFYKMFEKVGHVRKESERLEKLRKANLKTKQFSECHRSHKGLFVGLLIFMATLVAMSLFFIFIVKNETKNTAITLYQGTELVLLSVSTITCIISLFRLRALKLSDLSEEVAFDDNLLLIGLVGMLFYDLFLLVPALEAIPNGAIAAKLYTAKSILEMIQSMLQVFFILEASRRCAGTLEHVQNKPGRTMITFLLVLNLAMWFVNTFEVKRADNHSIHINYYSSMAWRIITHIALPLIVFFRFHSTVCLSDIWANAYRFRTE